jgi:hypothetical protein
MNSGSDALIPLPQQDPQRRMLHAVAAIMFYLGMVCLFLYL